MKKESKKGISLMVLVITIIIIIILAVSVILTVNNNNPMSNASQATFKSDIATYKNEMALLMAKHYEKNNDVSALENFTKVELREVLTGVQGKTFNGQKYTDIFAIRNGELCIRVFASDLAKQYASELGIPQYERLDITIFPDRNAGRVEGQKEYWNMNETIQLKAIPNTGYRFAYWVERKRLKTQNPIEPNLTNLQKNTAIFAKEGECIVIFTDKSDNILDIQSVKKGENAENPITRDKDPIPTPNGFQWIFTGWNKSFQNIQSDTIVKANGKADTNVTYHVNVINGTIANGGAEGNYPYQTKITINASDAPQGKKFGYWVQNNKIIHYDKSIPYYVLGDGVLEAVYVNEGESIQKDAIAFTERAFYYDEGDVEKMLWATRTYIPEGYTRVETGIIAMASNVYFDVNTPNIKKGLGSPDPKIKDFWYNAKGTPSSELSVKYVRAYLKYKDDKGNEKITYGEILPNE